MNNNKYTPVIGLEIHVELATKSKMFCQCDADYFGKEPNTNTCPVCLGMPGALPVPNRQAVEWAIKIGQALSCKINRHSKFDRKHYFYPDLPKAYQISQYDEPFAEHGHYEIQNPKSNSPKKIGITRVHLEEDTGKLIHTEKDTLVDFNRSSVPLVEIVTEPDFDSAEDVKIFLEELHTIICYLDVSDANMEEGSMRMEPNISLSTIENYELRITNLPQYKVEVKNINSFNFAKRAIDFELKRQAEILVKGETPIQETRGYNENKGITYSQRSKEDAHDYRYFPEPDIPPMSFTDQELETIRKTIPELPIDRLNRYLRKGLKYDDAFRITRDPDTANYTDKVVKHLEISVSENVKVEDKNRRVLISNPTVVVANAVINKKISTDQLEEHFAKKLLESLKPKSTDMSMLNNTIDSVIKKNPKLVEQYKKGKTGLLGFFVGQVMKEMKGQADPQKVNEMLKKRIAQL